MKNFYAFVGQNASTGTPNPVTGNYSRYGNIIAFSTIAKRDRFVGEYYNQQNPQEFAEKCRRCTARKYNLGMSVEAFNDSVLGYADTNVDEHYNSFFGQ